MKKQGGSEIPFLVSAEWLWVFFNWLNFSPSCYWRHFLTVNSDFQLPSPVTLTDSSCLLTSLWHLTLPWSFLWCCLASHLPQHTTQSPLLPLSGSAFDWLEIIFVFLSLEPWNSAPRKGLLTWSTTKSLDWLREELWRQEDRWNI